MLEPMFRAGDTYAIDPDITAEQAYQLWISAPAATFVASENNHILGTYYIKANQAGNGRHVCNCGYVVSEQARGKGIARLMCEHSQQQAIELGFRAMQYNCVVATNTAAIKLWQRCGFDIVGQLPQAFCHPQQGYVDAFVMYKSLVD